MNRRSFLGRSCAGLAGLAFGAAPCRVAAQAANLSTATPSFFARFPACTDFEAIVPVVRIATGRIIHRFFDTSPISPSGRYVGLFRLPSETQSPRPGEAGEVVIVDLQTGTERVVGQSRGWEAQMGANVQWGRTDAELYYNDVDPASWTPFVVQHNITTDAKRRLEGTVFSLSPNGEYVTSYNLVTSRRIQVGYGVVLPDELTPRNLGPVDHDGLFLTDVHTGKVRMIASIRDIYERAVPSIRVPDAEKFEFYCFQVRWNRHGTRLMAFLRWADPQGAKGGPRLLTLVTMKPDGSDIRVAVSPERYARGGHHPMWTPDGETITLNLNVRDGTKELDLVRVRYDGTDLQSIHPMGSGHPSMHPTLPFIVTDAYPHEPVTRGDGSAPLRLIDLRDKTEIALAHVNLTRRVADKRGSEFRIDAHPVWDSTGRLVIFNGVNNDTRSVFVADLGPWLEKAMRSANR